MVPVAPISITGITFDFTVHMRLISIIKSLYFKLFPAYFLITFLSPGITNSINMNVPCLLARVYIIIIIIIIIIRYGCLLSQVFSSRYFS